MSNTPPRLYMCKSCTNPIPKGTTITFNIQKIAAKKYVSFQLWCGSCSTYHTCSPKTFETKWAHGLFKNMEAHVIEGLKEELVKTTAAIMRGT